MYLYNIMNAKLWRCPVFLLGVLRALSFLHTNVSSVTLAAGNVFGVHECIVFPAVLASHSLQRNAFFSFSLTGSRTCL